MSLALGVVTHIAETTGVKDQVAKEYPYAVVFTKRAPTKEIYVYRDDRFLSILEVTFIY